VRKQYLALSGRPILWWTAKAFDRSPSIGEIILVVPREDVASVERQFNRHKLRKPLKVVAGGSTRAESVRRGLAAAAYSYRWIAVHDGVRPLVTPQLIERVLSEARAHRAAIAACPSQDTVKLAGRNNMIARTLPRETVWLAQTPQAFDRALLERAHRNGSKFAATDDAYLVEKLGVRVKLVASPPDNLKVTVPSDLEIAKKLIKRRA